MDTLFVNVILSLNNYCLLILQNYQIGSHPFMSFYKESLKIYFDFVFEVKISIVGIFCFVYFLSEK